MSNFQQTNKEIPMDKDSVYYQFRVDLNLPVFLQIKDVEIEKVLQYFIHEQGFTIVSQEVLQKAKNSKGFRLLRISPSGSLLSKRITSYSMHSFGLGQELIENFNYYEVYVYFHRCMMVMSQTSPVWEMAIIKEANFPITNSENKIALRLCFNRFLSAALSFHSIISLWGVVKEDVFYVTSKQEAEEKCVFVDMSKNQLFFESLAPKQVNEVKLIPVKDMKNNEVIFLRKEELYSYLSMRCLYFSSGQIPKSFIAQDLQKFMLRVRLLSKKPETILV